MEFALSLMCYLRTDSLSSWLRSKLATKTTDSKGNWIHHSSLNENDFKKIPRFTAILTLFQLENYKLQILHTIIHRTVLVLNSVI